MKQILPSFTLMNLYRTIINSIELFIEDCIYSNSQCSDCKDVKWRLCVYEACLCAQNLINLTRNSGSVIFLQSFSLILHVDKLDS